MNTTKSLCIVAVTGLLLGLLVGCAYVDEPPRGVSYTYDTHGRWSDLCGPIDGATEGKRGARCANGASQIRVGD